MSENYGTYPVCMECGDSISNPVCHECLKEQMFAYLADKRINGRMDEKTYMALRKAIGSLVRRLWSYRDTGIKCIGCQETLAICPYCFVRHVRGILASFGLSLSSFSFCFKFL